MKRITFFLLALSLLLTPGHHVLEAEENPSPSGPNGLFIFSHTKAETCSRSWTLMERILESANARCEEVFEISGFPYLRGTRAVLEMAKNIGTKYSQHEWLELLRRIDLQARYVELARLSPQDIEKFCNGAGIDCFQGRIRAYVARCSAIIMGDEKRNHDFMNILKAHALMALQKPVHGPLACFQDRETLDGLITADVLKDILSPSSPASIRSTSYLEKRILGSKKALRP